MGQSIKWSLAHAHFESSVRIDDHDDHRLQEKLGLAFLSLENLSFPLWGFWLNCGVPPWQNYRMNIWAVRSDDQVHQPSGDVQGWRGRAPVVNDIWTGADQRLRLVLQRVYCPGTDAYIEAADTPYGWDVSIRALGNAVPKAVINGLPLILQGRGRGRPPTSILHDDYLQEKAKAAIELRKNRRTWKFIHGALGVEPRTLQIWVKQYREAKGLS